MLFQQGWKYSGMSNVDLLQERDICALDETTGPWMGKSVFTITLTVVEYPPPIQVSVFSHHLLLAVWNTIWSVSADRPSAKADCDARRWDRIASSAGIRAASILSMPQAAFMSPANGRRRMTALGGSYVRIRAVLSVDFVCVKANEQAKRRVEDQANPQCNLTSAYLPRPSHPSSLHCHDTDLVLDSPPVLIDRSGGFDPIRMTMLFVASSASWRRRTSISLPRYALFSVSSRDPNSPHLPVTKSDARPTYVSSVISSTPPTTPCAYLTPPPLPRRLKYVRRPVILVANARRLCFTHRHRFASPSSADAE
ncbi:hypothetical protein R3P38DRAFT_3169540 [Favolaschia claudopus]|uniref:Uncharacterized protein n=1 Tax=Favolaschia claudopus TaxID=2862362 RepID=A0AAW0DZU0_9AGAR